MFHYFGTMTLHVYRKKPIYNVIYQNHIYLCWLKTITLFTGQDKYAVYVRQELNRSDHFVEKYITLVDSSNGSEVILVPQEIIATVSAIHYYSIAYKLKQNQKMFALMVLVKHHKYNSSSVKTIIC